MSAIKKNMNKIFPYLTGALSAKRNVYFTDGTVTRKVLSIEWSDYGFDLLIDNGDNKSRWVYLPISWPSYELDGYALAEMDGDLYIAPDWWIKI